MKINIIGDTHGEWNYVFEKIKNLEIRDCLLIHVGDVGIGFRPENGQRRQFEELNSFFSARNIQFKAIRGNHDNKKYFDENVKLSNFELLPDYTYREFNGEKFLFVGGAVSIDRKLREPNVSWWKDEIFVLKPELCQKVDVLITHTAQTWNGPCDKNGIKYWCERDSSLWEDCKEERFLLDKLIELCQPKNHFAGHFHRYYFSEVGGIKSRILAEHEIISYEKID